VLVTGEAKRTPLQRLAEGEDLPAARITGPVTWLLDRAASDT
jgi:6-phosphogluconolactonase